MFLEGKRVYFLLTLISFFLTIVIGIIYMYTNEIKMLLFTLLSLFISIILYTFNNIKYYIIHLIFYITIFIFLVSRPTIDYFKNGTFDTYQIDAYKFSFLSVITSLIGLVIGGLLVSKKEKYTDRKDKRKEFNKFIISIRRVSLLIFSISYPFYLIRLIERLLYRREATYYEYYANFQSQLPYLVYIISTFAVPAMCIYLATKPNKLHSTGVLASFILGNGINLLIGTRNPFVLSLIFAFLYYFIRNQTEKGVWLGVKEKAVLYIGTPIMMLAMGFLNYARDGESVGNMSIGDLLLDFIYKQGTSFGVLARGYLYESDLPIKEFRNYTFSSLIEYITKGSIGLLFGAKPFTVSNNSVELGIQSDRYAHNISYVAIRDDYLVGHGIGSSYIMEIYTDYGILGVFLFSILLGIIFILIMKSAYKNYVLLFSVSLLVLNNLFFMPRSSFLESFFNLFTMQFWGIVIVIYFAAGLITKRINYISKSKGDN